MRKRFFYGFVRFICKQSSLHPWLFLFLALITSLIALLQFPRLGLDTNLIRLLSQESRSGQLNKEFENIMIGSGGFFVILLEDPDKESLLPAFYATLKKVQNLRGIDSVEYKNPRAFIQKYRYLLVPSDDLNKILDRLIRLETELNPIGVDLLYEKPKEEETEEQEDEEIRDLMQYLNLPLYHQNENGQVMALKIYPDKGATNLGKSQKLYIQLQSISQQITEEFKVWTGVNGSLRSDLDQYNFILNDLSRSGVIIFFLVLGAIFIGFKKIRIIPIVLFPLLLGLIWTLGSIPFITGDLNTVTSFLLLVSFGLGIDFSIHIVKRFQFELKTNEPFEALLTTFLDTGKSILLSGLTTALALFILIFSKFRAFSEFGLLGSYSIFMILLAVMVFLPSVIIIGNKIHVLKPRPEGRSSLKSPGVLITLSIMSVVFIALIIGRLGMTFDYDYSNMEISIPEDKEIKDRYYEVYKSTRSPGAMYVAKGENALDDLLSQLRLRKRDEDKTRIRQFISVRELCPGIEEAQKRRILIEEIKDTLSGRWIKRVEDADEKELIEDILEWIPPNQNVRIEDLPDVIKDRMISRNYPDFFTIPVYIKGEKQKGQNAMAFADELNNMAKNEQILGPYGETIVLAEILHIVITEGPWLVAAVFLGVFLLIFLYQRSLLQTLWILTPLITGLILTMGLMVVSGIKLNFLNIVVFPTLIGIGVDDGVHYFRRWKEKNRDTNATQNELFGPLSLTTATTLFSYMGIALSRHPGLQTIGILACIGLTCTWLTTLFLLPGLLNIIYKRKTDQYSQNSSQKKNCNSTFSVLIPFYNEALYLERTIVSWLKQTRLPDQIILVDNGSTDESKDIARQTLKGINNINIIQLNESRPGKIHALETGLRVVSCEFVALADADTIYPPQYLELCEHLFASSDTHVSALMALPEYSNPDHFFSKLFRMYFILLHKISPKHVFTGGYGQVFRTQSLAQAGGFSLDFWPYVLLDHEIMYRIFKKGISLYHMDLWCKPSTRRQNRSRVRWNLLERLLYNILPYSMHDWLFYRFLGPRFEKRGLTHLRLREKPKQES